MPPMLDILTAIGSIATPILVLIVGAIGYKLRSRTERIAELENKLREDRIETYNQILEPFIIILTKDEAFDQKKYKGKDKNRLLTEKIVSLEYRKAAFKMSLVGSDNVIKAYNKLMQHFYHQPETSNDEAESESSIEQITRLFSLLGRFLLEIRISLGNETTTLTNWDMLSWLLTDMEKYQPKQNHNLPT